MSKGVLPVLLVVAFLAGCSDPPAPEQPPLFDEPADVAAGKGVLRGVVVNPALSPVDGAIVLLTQSNTTLTTGAEGTFEFLDLEPGLYFVQVSKPGWTQTQQSVDVVADVANPPVAKVLIEKLPGSEPRVLTLQQDGFIACSVGTPINYQSCDLSGADNPELFFDVEGVPSFVQTEVTWTSTQPSGDWLYVIQGLCTCEGNLPSFDNRFDETAEATSPWTARANATFLQGAGIGTPDAAQVLVSVSASGPEPGLTNGSGLALNQAFKVFVTLFYNIEAPDPEWTFIEDGPYPVPPA